MHNSRGMATQSLGPLERPCAPSCWGQGVDMNSGLSSQLLSRLLELLWWLKPSPGSQERRDSQFREEGLDLPGRSREGSGLRKGDCTV